MTEQYDVQDLSEVKADKNLLPPTKNLRVRIEKAATQANNDKDIHSLKLELRIVDGIPNNEGVMQYVNKPMFTGIMDLVYGAKLDAPNKGRESSKWWKNSQHLVEFKNFCKALDIPLSGIKVNDEFLSDLIGREVLVDVVHEADTVADPTGAVGANGKVKKVKTGEFREKLKNWKRAA